MTKNQSSNDESAIRACLQCDGPVERSSAEQARVVAGTTFVVRAPAFSCRRCDAVFMTGEALHAVDLRVAGHLARNATPSGERLRFIRKSLGLRAVGLATLVGVTNETVSRWENGQRPVDRNIWILVGSLVLEQLGEPATTFERLTALNGKRPHEPKVVRLAT